MAQVAWATLLEDRVLCDMHIISQDGDRIPVHKLVLAAQSKAIREAIENLQPSEEEFVFHVDFPAKVIQQVVTALYTGTFESLPESCTTLKQEKPVGSPDESANESKDNNDSMHPLHMMFCAQSIKLMKDLRLFSSELRKQAAAKLRNVAFQNINHPDFPAVVEYTLNHNYTAEFTANMVPWFVSHYKDLPPVREILNPILLKHPGAATALCHFLANGVDITEAKLKVAKREFDLLKLTVSKASESSGSSTKPSTSHRNRASLDQAFPAGPQVGSKRPRNG